MNPSELVELIKKEKPELLEKLPEKRVAALVREALVQISKQLDAVEEGVVKVAGFGTFNVRQVVRKREGKDVTVKQVVYRAPKPKQDAQD
jgi:nucleoid DNA-binding protein